MPTTALVRLNRLHTSLQQLRDADSALLRPDLLDTRLNELAAVIEVLQRLDNAQSLLNDLGGAMALLLELLQCADQKLDGCLLHCLLKPFKEKIDQVMDEMERVV